MNPCLGKYIHVLVCTIVFTCFIGCGDKEPVVATKPAETGVASTELPLSDRDRVRIVSKSENLLQELASEMKQLSGSFCSKEKQKLRFVSEHFTHSRVSQKSVAQYLTELPDHHDDHAVKSFYCEISPDESESGLHELFGGLLGQLSFDDMQIGTLDATFVADDHFEVETKLEGRVKLDDESMLGLKGTQILTWTNEGTWKLSKWRQKKLKATVSKRALFENVTDAAFPDTATREKLARSSHQDLIRKMVASASEGDGKMLEPRDSFKGFADWFSSYQYPSVSVFDYDNDGLDDLYVTDRWQPGQLLRNVGNGTFEDATESSGLLIEELANCVYFVDFDNDGDKDAFVGISMGPSKFFRNEDGKFKPDEVNNAVVEKSRFVVAASVVDINNDGLLDLYLSTYAYGFGSMADWYLRATYPEDQLKMLVRMRKQNQYVDRAGPPNILLMNRGEKFEWISTDDTVKQFHDSYQSTWSDIDNDGDMDVYICNDFANDVILRNDTSKGADDPVLVDATSDFIGEPKLNFAMGASWGDYDSDGDLDLYVSNMYSKAGMRICRQMPGVDERVSVSARGNYLYENNGGLLDQVAGLDESDQQVAIVGWSFGGQFADFDNDGRQDLYVPSGFYSPPKELHTDKDL